MAGLTRVELLVMVAICLAAMVIFPALLSKAIRGSKNADQLNHGRQIYLAMRAYASEAGNGGRFPEGRRTEGREELVGTSNAAFTFLMKKYIDDKRVFFNRQSAYCVKLSQSAATARQVLPGECDWVYVRGLTEKSDSQWPLLANAFAPGTTTYVDDPKQKGGVYRGENAVVIWAGGSAEVVETKKRGTTYFVKRADKPAANAFEKADDWLTGDKVQVLYPAAGLPGVNQPYERSR